MVWKPGNPSENFNTYVTIFQQKIAIEICMRIFPMESKQSILMVADTAHDFYVAMPRLIKQTRPEAYYTIQ